MNNKKRLHILLIHQAFVSIEEAGGTRHAETAQHLIEQGHRVTIIASPISYLTGRSRPSEKDADKSGIRVLRAATFRSIHRSFFLRLLNFFSFTISSFFVGLSVTQVDLIWGTSPPLFQAFSAWTLARIKRVPLLFEIRDLWPDFAVAAGVLNSPILIRASRWLERFLYRQADQLLVNSPGFLTHVEKLGGRDISVIPNGADPLMFHPEDRGESFRKKHNLQDKFVVLYAGAHGLSNDLEIVLQAALTLKKNPEIAIVLLGDGKDKAALIKHAQKLDLFNVHLLPPLAKTAMADALAGSDACLAILKPLELYKTVYPNKVFDYMAAGRPILLAIDGAIRRVVEKSGAGVFVNPGDPQALHSAILEIAAAPKLARKMGLEGRLYLEEHFNRKDLASDFNNLIELTVQNAQK
jgi:glycosyltransferase involved in cell wall biosynthesis